MPPLDFDADVSMPRQMMIVDAATTRHADDGAATLLMPLARHARYDDALRLPEPVI